MAVLKISMWTELTPFLMMSMWTEKLLRMLMGDNLWLLLKISMSAGLLLYFFLRFGKRSQVLQSAQSGGKVFNQFFLSFFCSAHSCLRPLSFLFIAKFDVDADVTVTDD